jgi:hypothetical protein
MKLSDLQPLDKVLVCACGLENPDWVINVDHRDAGYLNFVCNHDHTIDDMQAVHAAHLMVIFPQLRSLDEVPIGQTAIFDGTGWRLEDLPYEDGDNPGEIPPAPDKSLTLEGWTYTCTCCGQTRTGLPELSFDRPIQAHHAEGDPRYEIVGRNSDFCRIRIEGEEHFWIRGLLPVAIPEAGDTYCLGVWSTLSEPNFRRYVETFDDDQRDLGGMFGYLSNWIPGMPDSVNLELAIVPGEPGQRPWFLLRTPQDPHPLFDLQREGLTADQLFEWIGPHLACVGSA